MVKVEFNKSSVRVDVDLYYSMLSACMSLLDIIEVQGSKDYAVSTGELTTLSIEHLKNIIELLPEYKDRFVLKNL